MRKKKNVMQVTSCVPFNLARRTLRGIPETDMNLTKPNPEARETNKLFREQQAQRIKVSFLTGLHHIKQSTSFSCSNSSRESCVPLHSKHMAALF